MSEWINNFRFTPLEEVLLIVKHLIRAGIRQSDHHLHIGENGTRYEFCGKPLQAKIHDPLRLERGIE